MSVILALDTHQKSVTCAHRAYIVPINAPGLIVNTHKMTEPPQDVKTTIEKTVQYVRKNGVSFEEKLLANDPDGKFGFLNESNPHNAYYKSVLEGQPTSKNGHKTLKNEAPAKEIDTPDQLLFVTDLPPLSNHDLDVIKLTAQYIACNTPKHAEALQRYMTKKGNRSQFAFLSRGHSLHPLFQSYCKQYQAIIDVAKSNKEGTKATSKGDKNAVHIDKLINSTPQDLFERAYRRAAFEKKNKNEKKAQESEDRKAQLQYALIDWQDFAFVAKINFHAVDEVTELAVPLLREDVMYRALLAKSRDLQLETAQTQPKPEEPKPKDELVHSPPPAPASVPKGMKIRAAGETRLKRKQKTSSGGEKTIQCPITGQQIPELEFDHHLKVLLRDPKYKEQQDNFVKKNFTYASNLTTDQVYENIKRLVRKRGLSEEEEEQEKAKRIDIGPQ